MSIFSKRTLIAASLAAAFVGLSATAIAQNTAGPGNGNPAGMSPELHAQHMAQRGADATPGQGMGQGMGQGKGQGDKAAKLSQRMEKMQQRRAERQAQLKTALKITPEQEAAWTAFVAGSAHAPRMGQRGMGQDMAQMTTPQRLDKMQAQHAERSAEMAQRIDATKRFYAALSPEQQKVFDTQGHGFQRAGMKGEHRMDGKGVQGERGGYHRMGGKGGKDGGSGCEGRTPQRG
jgi:hypothetical protein